MEDMKKDIIQVYKVVGDPSALEGKETIDVLQVSIFFQISLNFYNFQEIEIHINELMKMINIIALDEDAPGGRNAQFNDRMKKAE